MKRLPLQMTFFFTGPSCSLNHLFYRINRLLTPIQSRYCCPGRNRQLDYLRILLSRSQVNDPTIKFGGSFLIMILFFNTLLNQKFQPILWHFHWGVITYKFSYPAFLYGMAMAIVLISMLFIFALLNKILTPNRLIYVFSPIAPRLAMLVSISFSLVANFIIKFRRLITLQKKREMSILPVVH